MMRGHFEGGILGQHTFCWTFTPTHVGELAVVLPVHEQGRLVDLLAIARHDYRVWGVSHVRASTLACLLILYPYTTHHTVG